MGRFAILTLGGTLIIVALSFGILLLVILQGFKRGESRSLGSRTRRIAVIFVLFGLATFFIPLITVNPPVLGSGRWSPVVIAGALCDGRLPVSTTQQSLLLNWVVIQFAVTYLLLVVALISLVFFPSSGVLAGVSAIVLVVTVGGRGHSAYDRFVDDMQSLLYTARNGQVNHDQYVIAVLCVMFALAAVAYFDHLDSLPK